MLKTQTFQTLAAITEKNVEGINSTMNEPPDKQYYITGTTLGISFHLAKVRHCFRLARTVFHKLFDIAMRSTGDNRERVRSMFMPLTRKALCTQISPSQGSISLLLNSPKGNNY